MSRCCHLGLVSESMDCDVSGPAAGWGQLALSLTTRRPHPSLRALACASALAGALPRCLEHQLLGPASHDRRDLTLEGADRQAHLWHAFGTECSAVHRHKAASLAAAAAARSRAAVPSAARGTSDGASCAELAAAAAAEVAAWAGANAGLVQQLLARIQAVLR